MKQRNSKWGSTVFIMPQQIAQPTQPVNFTDEEVIYLTELLGLKVYDLKGRHIGTFRDAALVPLVDPVRVDRFLVGAGPGWLSIRYDQIQSITRTGIHLKDERLTPYHSDEYMLRIARDLLDQQVIDAQGRKVVRVNDVTFVKNRENGGDILNILEIDVGIRSMLRRVLSGIVHIVSDPHNSGTDSAALHPLGILQHAGSGSAAACPAEHFEQAAGEHASGRSGRYCREPWP